MDNNLYTEEDEIFEVQIAEDEEVKEHLVVDYFPLSRVFVDTFFQTVGFILTLWAILNLIMLSSNLFTWVESFGDITSRLIQAATETYNEGPDTNLGAVEAACFLGGIGSCTGANTVPDFYVPFNPLY